MYPEETDLHFGRIEQGSAPPHRTVRLLGPPIARACAPRASHDWIRVNETDEGFDISVDTANEGVLCGTLDLKGPTGEAVIAVDVELLPAPSEERARQEAEQAEQRQAEEQARREAEQREAEERARQEAEQREAARRNAEEQQTGDKLATWWQRVAAHLLDLLALLIPGLVLGLRVTVGKATYGLGVPSYIGVLVVAAIWLYNRCYLQGRTGQSWGKRAVGLKLIHMSDKEPIGSWKAAIRNLAHVLDILTLYLLPIWDARRQTVADKAMKTVVISLKA